MTCEQAESLLVRAADGTLDADRRAEMDRHLATCAACREAMDVQRSARALLGARPDAAVRPGFATRVMANLPAQDPGGALDTTAFGGGDWLNLLNWRAWTIRLARSPPRWYSPPRSASARQRTARTKLTRPLPSPTSPQRGQPTKARPTP